jgi:hypothetical protein
MIILLNQKVVVFPKQPLRSQHSQTAWLMLFLLIIAMLALGWLSFHIINDPFFSPQVKGLMPSTLSSINCRVTMLLTL